VKDIAPGPRSSSPADLTPAGGLLYFTVSDAVRGRALWKSDGTARGTVPVEGTPEDFVFGLRAVGRYLFFSTFSGLWRTDGTAAGTLRLTSTPSELLTPVGNVLYFARSSPAEQAGLWRTDGTPGGTRRVSPVRPVLSAVAVGERLFFIAGDAAHGFELWTSDGTAEGTLLVKDIHPGPAGSFTFGSSMTALGARLFFFADDGNHGLEPWVSDGSEAGTYLVEELFPGAEGANFVELVGDDRLAFFRILRYGERELLWRSDGTAAGTFVVACVGAFNLTLIDGLLFFNGDDYTGAGSEPWRSDGTTAGTWRLQDLAPGPAYTSTLGFTRLGSKVLFFAEDGGTGLEPWSVPYHSRGDGSPPPSVTSPASAGSR
ncbi:MAG: hyalin, partial [Candidatus Eisenbacteria bacterium]|nr:hyalin [Candidatus Eisenbacteria bacterium]